MINELHIFSQLFSLISNTESIKTTGAEYSCGDDSKLSIFIQFDFWSSTIFLHLSSPKFSNQSLFPLFESSGDHKAGL